MWKYENLNISKNRGEKYQKSRQLFVNYKI